MALRKPIGVDCFLMGASGRNVLRFEYPEMGNPVAYGDRRCCKGFGFTFVSSSESIAGQNLVGHGSPLLSWYGRVISVGVRQQAR